MAGSTAPLLSKHAVSELDRFANACAVPKLRNDIAVHGHVLVQSPYRECQRRLLLRCWGRRHTIHEHHRRCSLVSRPHGRPITTNTISSCLRLRAVHRAPVLGESTCQRRPSRAVLQLHVPRRSAAAFAAGPPQFLADGVACQSPLDRGRQSGLPRADCIMSSKPRSDHIQRHSLMLLVRVSVVAVRKSNHSPRF